MCSESPSPCTVIGRAAFGVDDVKIGSAGRGVTAYETSSRLLETAVSTAFHLTNLIPGWRSLPFPNNVSMKRQVSKKGLPAGSFDGGLPLYVSPCRLRACGRTASRRSLLAVLLALLLQVAHMRGKAPRDLPPLRSLTCCSTPEIPRARKADHKSSRHSQMMSCSITR